MQLGEKGKEEGETWSQRSWLQFGFGLGSLRMRDTDNGPLMDVLQRGKALVLATLTLPSITTNTHTHR